MCRPYFNGHWRSTLGPMLADVGDVIEDIVVRHEVPGDALFEVQSEIEKE
jgi:hypothetical protein